MVTTSAPTFDAEFVRQAATGRWRDIFSTLNIDVPAHSKLKGPCPACGGKDRFRFDDLNGEGTWFCNQCHPKAGDGFALIRNVKGCSFPEALRLIGEALHLQPTNGRSGRTVVSTYDYTDASGTLLFQVVRFDPKDFRQRQPDGHGKWMWNLKGIEPVLFHLPEVRAASSALLVEGEKDVETAYRLGLPEGWAATCNPMGAEKWRDSYSDALAGKHVVILPDADEPGRRHGVLVAQSLAGKAASVRALSLSDGSKDLSEWAVDRTAEDFHALLESASHWAEPVKDLIISPSLPVPASIEWPQGPPIALETPILPTFPPDVLPKWLNDMAQAVAHHTETPVELSALIGLGVLATCCQRTFVIQPKPDYCEPLNVWTVVALESGNRKTSVMQHMTKPLRDADRERCEASKTEMLRIETERENINARVKSLRGRLGNAGSEDNESIEQEIHKLERSRPEAPTLPRLWVQDITPEKLGQTLAENGERLSIVSDEGGVFDIMAGRYSNGVPNLDVYLQSHAGGAVRVDRGNRLPVMMEHPALTIALSPQPEVLRGLTEKPGFRSRGLLARFLYALPSSPLGYRTLRNVPIPAGVESAYRTQLISLLNMQPPCNEFGETAPFILRMAEASYQEWHEFALEVEMKMRDEGPYEHIRDWAGKLPGAAARLAGLFHCARYAQGQPWTVDVELETVQMALGLTAILTTHALAAFDMMGADPALGAARKVWRWVQAGQRKTFTARECFQHLRSPFPRMTDLDPAFEVLLDRGYLQELPNPKKGQGLPGRRSRILMVNPILTEGWS